MEPTGVHTGRAADDRGADVRRSGARELARPAAASTSFSHAAGFYRSPAEYVESLGAFIRASVRRDQHVMVAVPTPNLLLLSQHLGALAHRVSFTDMTALGRNPGRIIPAIQSFANAHAGRPVCYVGEPVWRSRTEAERGEVRRHEALLNVAFARQQVSVLCPYDAGLGADVLAEAEQTHPALLQSGRLAQSTAFTDMSLAELADGELPEPPAAGVEALAYRDDPGAARAFVRDRARAAGLPEARITDLVIAVGELAANTLKHTTGTGSVGVWATAAEVICEVRDGGHIDDVMAGRRYPAPDAGRGHGLWVVHQVCDLVEMRTGGSGTTFRLHMGLSG